MHGPCRNSEAAVGAHRMLDHYRFNELASVNPVLGALTWWLLPLMIGLAAWPLIWPLFSGLPDRGYVLSRPIGWLAVSLPIWWLAHLRLPAFTVAGVWIACGVLFVAGALTAARRFDHIRDFLRAKWRLLAIWELGFAAAYLAGLVLRLANPDLWHPWFGGEKFMEMAIWNGLLRSPELPPADPHFAGETLNYYYFGHFILAVLTKLTGVWTEVAFNLALPLLLGLSFLLSWAVAFYLHASPGFRAQGGSLSKPPPNSSWKRHLTCSLWSPFLLLLASSPVSGAIPLQSLATRGITWFEALDRDYWWHVSRVIPFTINEFPGWSFVFGDLHAHLLNLPLILLLLALSAAASASAGARRQVLGISAIMGILCAFIVATNLWDLPLALLICGSTLLGACLWRRDLGERAIAFCLLALFSFAVMFFLTVAPFLSSFVPVGAGGLGLVTQGDSLSEWLGIWGLFALILGGWVFLRVGEVVKRSKGRGILGPLLLLALCCGLVGSLNHQTLALTLAGIGLLLIALAGFPNFKAAAVFVPWLAILLCVLAGSQLVFVKDFLEGSDYFRMNTVFKFSFQAWILAAVVCGFMLPVFWRELCSKCGRGTQTAAGIGLAAMLALSMGFPVLGIPARLAERFPNPPAWGTLNGLDYMDTAVLDRPDGSIVMAYDREAIDWINRYIRRNATVLEAANVDYYRAAGTRVASLTGLSGLYGMHQLEQRPAAVASGRAEAMKLLWNTEDESELANRLRQEGVDLVYVGQNEILEHAPGAARFLRMAEEGRLRILYWNERTVLLALPEFQFEKP